VARDYVGKLKVKTPSVEQETLRLIVDARARPLPFSRERADAGGVPAILIDNSKARGDHGQLD
jgi:hypothetical protein